jgi:hypothetical protein
MLGCRCAPRIAFAAKGERSMAAPLRHCSFFPLAAGVLALLGGCASTQLDAQWADPQLAPNSLRGARVLVACDAYEQVVRRICADQLAAEVVARGATPVVAPEGGLPAPGQPQAGESYLAAAREAGARAVLASTIRPSATHVSPGLQIGIGGFGFGSGGFGGIGVSAPLGGGQISNGYTANSRVTDAHSGRLLWTARATSPPSADLNAQMAELAKTVLGAADKAGLF